MSRSGDHARPANSWPPQSAPRSRPQRLAPPPTRPNPQTGAPDTPCNRLTVQRFAARDLGGRRVTAAQPAEPRLGDSATRLALRSCGFGDGFTRRQGAEPQLRIAAMSEQVGVTHKWIKDTDRYVCDQCHAWTGMELWVDARTVEETKVDGGVLRSKQTCHPMPTPLCAAPSTSAANADTCAREHRSGGGQPRRRPRLAGSAFAHGRSRPRLRLRRSSGVASWLCGPFTGESRQGAATFLYLVDTGSGVEAIAIEPVLRIAKDGVELRT